MDARNLAPLRIRNVLHFLGLYRLQVVGLLGSIRFAKSMGLEGVTATSYLPTVCGVTAGMNMEV